MTGRKRQGLRASEITAAFRLVMECTELWYDPAAWRTRLARGVWELTRAGVVVHETYDHSQAHPEGALLSMAAAGWRDGAAPRGFDETMNCSTRDRGLPAEITQHVLSVLPRQGHVVVSAYDVAGERAWRNSRFFEQFLEPFGLVDGVASFRSLPQPGHIGVLNINRAQGQSPVRPWQRALLELVHAAVAPLVGTRLAVEGQRSTAGLSPRRRQVLELLLDGLSEKEVASRLGLAQPTAHQYVGDLYRWFGVRSRPELMAYFVRRRVLDRPRAIPASQGPPSHREGAARPKGARRAGGERDRS